MIKQKQIKKKSRKGSEAKKKEEEKELQSMSKFLASHR